MSDEYAPRLCSSLITHYSLPISQPIRQSLHVRKLPRRHSTVHRGLAFPIDPRIRHAESIRRDDVVEVALRGVQPAGVADALARGDEVRRRGLVRTDLFGGDDEVE